MLGCGVWRRVHSNSLAMGWRQKLEEAGACRIRNCTYGKRDVGECGGLRVGVLSSGMRMLRQRALQLRHEPRPSRVSSVRTAPFTPDVPRAGRGSRRLTDTGHSRFTESESWCLAVAQCVLFVIEVLYDGEGRQ